MKSLDLTVMDHHNVDMSVKNCMRNVLFDVIRSCVSYKDVHISKLPLDCWIFQEIIYERKPTIIIEIGNQAGGSTMMLRDYLFASNSVGARGIIGIDISRDRLSKKAKNADHIKWIDGDARSTIVLNQVKDFISPYDKVMIIDDSSHEYHETFGILNLYAPLVTRGQYFIVEDTIYGGLIPFGEHRPRACHAVIDFLKKNKKFKVDREREKFFITLNPGGYLEKIG